MEYPLNSVTDTDQRILDSIRSGLAGHYLPRGDKPGQLPFHNIDHALESERIGAEYCKYVRGNGKKVDEFCVRAALLLHDSGYNLNQSAMEHRFPKRDITSKELYASLIATDLLESYGVDSPRVAKVGRLILATHKDAQPKSREAKIVVRSDIDNVCGPSESFFSNTAKLIKEAEMLEGHKNIFERLVLSEQILREIISKDLCFGDFDQAFYESWFNQPALANITRLGKISVQSAIGSVVDHIPFFGNTDSNKDQ